MMMMMMMMIIVIMMICVVVAIIGTVMTVLLLISTVSTTLCVHMCIHIYTNNIAIIPKGSSVHYKGMQDVYHQRYLGITV